MEESLGCHLSPLASNLSGPPQPPDRPPPGPQPDWPRLIEGPERQPFPSAEPNRLSAARARRPLLWRPIPVANPSPALPRRAGVGQEGGMAKLYFSYAAMNA